MDNRIERFAPSPTGPLHFGSLVCAFISYICAKQQNAEWLVRIEDVDRQRCDDKFVPLILKTLEHHGMHWDREVVTQSHRSNLYEGYLTKLGNLGEIYSCWCTRKEIQARSQHYDGYCRRFDTTSSEQALSFSEHPNAAFKKPAVRWRNSVTATTFFDQLLEHVSIDSFMNSEDPILKRADGCYAYHLAVVVDDIEQSISRIVRGADLLDSTPIHMRLFELFNATPPEYLHIPIAVHSPGIKYAKQRKSPAINDTNAVLNLKSCLSFMGVSSQDSKHLDSVEEIIRWATVNWSPAYLPKQREIIVSESNSLYSVHS